MHLLYGNMHMERGDYNRAIQSFEDARLKLGSRKKQLPLIVALVYALLPRNVLKLTLISHRFQGGNLMILQSRFNSDRVRPSL